MADFQWGTDDSANATVDDIRKVGENLASQGMTEGDIVNTAKDYGLTKDQMLGAFGSNYGGKDYSASINAGYKPNDTGLINNEYTPTFKQEDIQGLIDNSLQKQTDLFNTNLDNTLSRVNNVAKPDKVVAPTYNPEVYKVNNNQLVSTGVNNLLAEDSDYLKQARLYSQQQSNARGLLNSGMAIDAAHGAAIDRAGVIAQGDAEAYQQGELERVHAINQSRADNAKAQLDAALANGEMEQQQYDTAVKALYQDLSQRNAAAANAVQSGLDSTFDLAIQRDQNNWRSFEDDRLWDNNINFENLQQDHKLDFQRIGIENSKDLAQFNADIAKEVAKNKWDNEALTDYRTLFVNGTTKTNDVIKEMMLDPEIDDDQLDLYKQYLESADRNLFSSAAELYNVDVDDFGDFSDVLVPDASLVTESTIANNLYNSDGKTTGDAGTDELIAANIISISGSLDSGNTGEPIKLNTDKIDNLISTLSADELNTIANSSDNSFMLLGPLKTLTVGLSEEAKLAAARIIKEQSKKVSNTSNNNEASTTNIVNDSTNIVNNTHYGDPDGNSESPDSESDSGGMGAENETEGFA